MKNQPSSTMMLALLKGSKIERTHVEGQTLYAVLDVIAAFSDSQRPAELWTDLKVREPDLAGESETLEATDTDGTVRSAEFLTLAGVMRLAQSIPGRRAERVRKWLAINAVQRLAEENDPELAVLRARRLYERRGRDRRWVDKRLRGMSARHELTSEWAKRGAAESEQFRALTNDLMRASFGMDVNEYRRFKGLSGGGGSASGRSLRDHMNGLELALTTLGETTAAALGRVRNSQGIEALERDAKDAGEIVATARQAIEARQAAPVVTPA